MYRQVTVHFADVFFKTLHAQITPTVLVELVNKMFRVFDLVAGRNEVENINTIGDSYMAATGLRMLSRGEPVRLHCSIDTYEPLKDDFECELRLPIKIKGKGEMQT